MQVSKLTSPYVCGFCSFFNSFQKKGNKYICIKKETYQKIDNDSCDKWELEDNYSNIEKRLEEVNFILNE
jgi:RPA family protein